VLQLIIFAALAAVVLFQLYSVLGRRVGRQPEDQPDAVPVTGRPVDRPADDLPNGGVSLSGLAAVRARDPGFDLAQFLGGARGAYEMIVQAFAAGDRATLKKLLSTQVMAGFDGAIAALETAGMAGDLARMTVRFLAELRSRTKSAAGEAVEDRRTAELWTFERNLGSRDPNWTLVRVDAAQA
jgi:predicted lipid-binding transport protein (Tim44 family)